ncbi:MAG: tetratricopeptide repeat protein [Elusimicrobia bacterium]|nr:tetratricopeptide repeat protein [Elusimicrobiota bacterium]
MSQRRPFYAFCLTLCLALGLTLTAGAAEQNQSSVETALQAYRAGSLHQALKGFLQVLIADPQNVTARRYVSVISRQLVQQRDSKIKGERGAMLDRAMRLMAEQEELLLHGQQALERDDVVSAIDLLWRVQQMDPTSEQAKKLLDRVQQHLTALASPKASVAPAERLRAQGGLHYLNRQWHLAIERWQEALPQSSKAELLRRDIAKADRYLQAVLQRERADLLAVKGKDFLQQGQLAEAKAAWEEALRLVPGHPEAVEGLSQIAKQEVRRAELARQEEVDHHFNEALELYVRGRYAESRNEWRAVLALNPEHPTAKEYLAKIEEHLGSEEVSVPAGKTPPMSASSDQFKSTRVPPTGPHPIPPLIPPAPQQPATSSKTAAKPALPAAVIPGTNELGWKKAPRKETAEDHYARGVKEQTVQRPQEAIREFQKALKLDPAHQEAAKALQDLRGQMGTTVEDYYKQGLIAYSQGKRAEAIKQWRSVLAIDPQHPKARRALLKAESEGSRSLAGE